MRFSLSRTTKAIAAGIFALMVFCPLLQEQLHWINDIPLTENRLKVQRPTDWTGLFKSGTPFAKQYEEYFNDNYGLRDLLIRTKNQLDYSLFGQSEKVFIGRDNWLFYKSVVEREQIDTERISDENWGKMLQRLLALNRALAARGIRLVVVPCPMKDAIYPEMLPPNAPRRPNPTAFDRYRRFLQDHPEIATVDPVPILMSLKSSLQVYYKTDFHWTDPAGAQVAKALVNKLGNLCGKGDLWDRPIKMKVAEQRVGGENQSLGLLWPYREFAPYLDPADMNTGSGEFIPTDRDIEWSFRSKLPEEAALVPDTVMFADSFGDAFLRAGYIGYFYRLQKFFNWELKEKYGSIPPGTRFVVLQHVEVLLNALQVPNMWPDELQH